MIHWTVIPFIILFLLKIYVDSTEYHHDEAITIGIILNALLCLSAFAFGNFTKIPF